MLSLDRLTGIELVMTQGTDRQHARRAPRRVTESALKLQRADLIRYSRGHIPVIDREGLEKRSCECYAVVKKEYDRLLLATMAT